MEPAEEWRALLSGAGIHVELSLEDGSSLFGRLDGMLVSKPGDLAEVAAAHVPLIIAMDELRLLI